MKKNKLAVFGMSLVLACGVGMFSACDIEVDGKKLGTVSDELWKQYFSLSVESCKSATIIETYGCAYSKEEAEEYGEWSNRVETRKVDTDKQIVYITELREQYRSGYDDVFTEKSSEEYYFAYEGAYYHWTKDGHRHYDEETKDYVYMNSVYKITKADFITIMEERLNDFAQLRVYADMKDYFKFNEETGMYDLMQAGTLTVSVQFLENKGLRLTQKDSINAMTIEISGIDSTSLELPAAVIEDVREYLAQEEEEA